MVLKEGQSLKELYEERVPLYKHYADVTIPENGKSLEETLQTILDELSL